MLERAARASARARDTLGEAASTGLSRAAASVDVEVAALTLLVD
jgi:hypothetical protein